MSNNGAEDLYERFYAEAEAAWKPTGLFAHENQDALQNLKKVLDARQAEFESKGVGAFLCWHQSTTGSGTLYIEYNTFWLLYVEYKKCKSWDHRVYTSHVWDGKVRHHTGLGSGGVTQRPGPTIRDLNPNNSSRIDARGRPMDSQGSVFPPPTASYGSC